MAEIGNLGKYELRREIGRGAMGVVYEAYDPMIKRVVALKTIRSDQLTGEESGTVIARFRREAQAAGRLSHPNIVPIYDFGEDGGVWFIAMEFIKGRELKEYFEANERFSVTDIVRIMSQMLDALDYSHRQGVIHRDIKPANVFLIDDGSVKVADFGIAHIDSSSLTQVGTVLGTPSYMSPEQIMGLPVDGRSDLFSAGVILYQFLTGERPFAGFRDDDHAEGAQGRPAAAVVAQRAGAPGDGCRDAQGARETRRRTLPDREGVRCGHPRRCHRHGATCRRVLPTSAEATMLSVPDPTLVAPTRAAAPLDRGCGTAHRPPPPTRRRLRRRRERRRRKRNRQAPAHRGLRRRRRHCGRCRCLVHGSARRGRWHEGGGRARGPGRRGAPPAATAAAACPPARVAAPAQIPARW